jgi:hypothetical protein
LQVLESLQQVDVRQLALVQLHFLEVFCDFIADIHKKVDVVKIVAIEHHFF